MVKKWLFFLMLAVAMISIISTAGCTSNPTKAPASENQQPFEVLSVLGPLQPINPGGPVVEITRSTKK